MVRRPLLAFGAALLIACGCKSGKPDLKPPKQPEVLALPPEGDLRYSAPMEYPPEVLKDAQQHKRLGSTVPTPQPGSLNGSGLRGPR
ncbi:MAG: hypothetical protein KatS3mg105_2158 [Gemmatales bacterium]|nr:MAG: hypothetical protein KatS3mg105_2158 [Gemmatales bacterium]